MLMEKFLDQETANVGTRPKDRYARREGPKVDRNAREENIPCLWE